MSFIYDAAGHVINLRANEAGELIVAEPTNVYRLKQVDIAPDARLATTGVANGGDATYDAATSSTILTATSDDDVAVLQSRWAPNYQPGKRCLVEQVGTPSGGGTHERMGLFSDECGIFYDFSTQEIVLRDDSTDTPLHRSQWNRDRLNGSGNSGLRVDNTKAVRMGIRFAWLSAGDVELGFFCGHKFVVAHRFEHFNQLVAPYMRTPLVPLRWEARDAGSVLYATCGSVDSEGGQTPGGIPGCASTLGATAVGGSGALVEICSIRIDANSDASVFFSSASIASTTNFPGAARLLWNPTFTGAATWADIDGHVEQNTAAGRAITDPGIDCGTAVWSSQNRSAAPSIDRVFSLGKQYDGTSDILTLAAQSVSTGFDAIGALNYTVIQ